MSTQQQQTVDPQLDQKLKEHSKNLENIGKAEYNVPTEAELKEELEQQLGLTKEKKEVIDPKIDQLTNTIVDNFFNGTYNEEQKKRCINDLGMKHQTRLSNQNAILDQSMQMLAKTQDGGTVAKDLLLLRNEVEALNPHQYNLTAPTSATAKFFRTVLGKKNPVSRYLERYEKGSVVLKDITRSLLAGKEGLKDDNNILSIDKKSLRDTLDGLAHAIKVGQVLDQKFEAKLREINQQEQPEEYRFLQEEVLFPLRQRIIDLQTAMNVNQQGVITYDLLIRNNDELIKGVERSVTITTVALSVGVTAQFALNKQRNVLEAVKGTKEVTEKILMGNAETLRTQGVEIQKAATEPTIAVDVLANAFTKLNEAVEDLSAFRTGALAGMKESISRLEDLTKKGNETIERIEKGEAVRKKAFVDITADDEL
jgi:uncharacterized protein YaaN involved in tellurite resistance